MPPTPTPPPLCDHELEHTLREQQVILDTAGVGIVFIHRRSLKRCNARFAEIFGHHQAHEALLRTNASLYPDAGAFHALGRAAYPVMAQGLPYKAEVRMKRANGDLFWAHLTGKLVNPADTDEGSIWIIDDIDEQKASAEQLQALLTEQALILDNALVAILFLQNRHVVRCNRAFETMLGYQPGELNGAASRTWYLSEQDWNTAAERCYAPLRRGETFREEMCLRRKNGQPVYVEVQARAIDPTDLDKGSIWTGLDITARRQAEEQLARAHAELERLVEQRTEELRQTVDALQTRAAEHQAAEERAQHLAHYDPLTGLPNRVLLHDRCHTALQWAMRHNHQVALLYLDLDHFKNINDSLGHRVGDEVLVELARRLRGAVREQDTVSRLGGDEFVLLLPETDAPGAASVAQKILQAALVPLHLEDHELTVTPSIGIALYPQDGSDLDSLSRCADAAMYQAKSEGRNGVRFFTASLQAQSERMLVVSNALRRCLERQQLSLSYQPQIDLETARVVGLEALVRWNHPELGAVSPAEFIGIAESNGLILPIGEWVLHEATQQLARWHRLGWTQLRVAVNLSAVQFRHANLLHLVSECLQEAGLAPRSLELELTEGVALHNPQQATAIMDELDRRGVRLSMDDFGTGYSSLNYLKRFRVYKLKIDQSFVRDLGQDAEDRAIVQTIIRMAQSLGLRTMAEGVETVEQREFLRAMGCDEIQGYLVSRPLPAAEMEVFLRQALLPPGA